MIRRAARPIGPDELADDRKYAFCDENGRGLLAEMAVCHSARVVPSTPDTIPRRIAESSATWRGLCAEEDGGRGRWRNSEGAITRREAPPATGPIKTSY